MSQPMTELDVKLKIPVKLIKKIKAYAVLIDQTPSEFIDYFTSEVLGKKLNDIVDALIRGELDTTETKFTTPDKVKESSWSDEISSPLDFDQGAELHEDQELYDEAQMDEEDLLKMKAPHSPVGASEEEVENDLDVQDPTHEAAGIPEEEVIEEETDVNLAEVDDTVLENRTKTLQKNEVNRFASFAERMNLDVDSIDATVVGRKKRNTPPRRGKVKAFGAAEPERSAF